MKNLSSKDLPESDIPLGAINIGATHIDPSQVLNFSLIALSVIVAFAGLLLGVIRTGDEKNGFKYVPLMLITALTLFYGTRLIISSIFGSFAVLGL